MISEKTTFGVQLLIQNGCELKLIYGLQFDLHRVFIS